VPTRLQPPTARSSRLITASSELGHKLIHCQINGEAPTGNIARGIPITSNDDGASSASGHTASAVSVHEVTGGGTAESRGGVKFQCQWVGCLNRPPFAEAKLLYEHLMADHWSSRLARLLGSAGGYLANILRRMLRPCAVICSPMLRTTGSPANTAAASKSVTAICASTNGHASRLLWQRFWTARTLRCRIKGCNAGLQCRNTQLGTKSPTMQFGHSRSVMIGHCFASVVLAVVLLLV
jgi:hypothetical protein